MWRHPRYAELTGRQPPGASTAEAPRPSGELLTTFPRRGPNGAPQELRVALDEYQGHPYISVRLWERDRPTRKGISVRISEAQGVADALVRALDLTGDGKRVNMGDRGQGSQSSGSEGDAPRFPASGTQASICPKAPPW
jgi:hypothetical protein